MCRSRDCPAAWLSGTDTVPSFARFPKRVVLVSGYKGAQSWDVAHTRGFSSFSCRKKRADPVSLGAVVSALLCGERHIWVFTAHGARFRAVFLRQLRKSSAGPAVGRGGEAAQPPQLSSSSCSPSSPQS